MNTLVSVLIAALGLILILFGCALLPSRSLGAIVSCALGFAALVYGLFAPDLGTTSILLWMGVGVLLIFFGVARVTTRLIPRLSVFMSPIARWSVFVLTRALLAVLHASILAPALRGLGAGRSRAARHRLRRRRAHQPPHPGDRPPDVAPKGGDPVGAGMARGVPRRDPRPDDDSDRRRKCAPEPSAHCVDRGRADDRSRSRRPGCHPRLGHRADVPRRGQRPLGGLGFDYAITAQNNFSPDTDRSRRGRREDAGSRIGDRMSEQARRSSSARRSS